MMTPERFQELRRQFDAVAEASAEDRDLALNALRSRDADLASELEQLLCAYQRREGFIEVPAADLHSPVKPVPDLVGSRIGPYEVVQEIGRGGMGTVFEAARIDGSFRKRVALKVIRATLQTDDMRERFRQERQILAGLDHPNIARILDGGATPEGQPYFVLEYVAGIRIDQYCRDNRLGIDARLDLFSSVCDAVQYAHDHLIVHRDLKPGNILVTPEGAVKLLDFGIAKILSDPGKSDTAPTSASALILTPEYASPEQVLGKPITTATDVYLLGVLLYELLAELHPIRAPGQLPHEVMRAVCEDEPVRPSVAATAGRRDFQRLPSRAKGELDHIVMMALQKDPRRRYSSVDQFRADVARYRNGQPVIAQGDRLTYRTSKFVRRNLMAVTASALVFLSLTAGVIVSARQATKARQEQREAELQRRIADVQRQMAQSEQREAARQRQQALMQQARAEQQTGEAEQQRRRADIERLRAEKRYGELRSLVTTLLFDLHDRIRDLAGSAPARRIVLSKALQYLEMLSKEAGGDLQLQRELATAYEQTGDLLHDAIDPNAKDASSLETYNKALQIRQAIAQRAPTDLSAQRELAFSLTKVGDGHLYAGDNKRALADYGNAFELQSRVLREGPSDAESRKVIGYIQNRRCIALASAGDALHANDACRESVLALEPLPPLLPNDRLVRRILASSCAAYGNLLRNLNQIPEALHYLGKATGLLEILAREQPNNVDYRRQISYTQVYVAHALMAQNDRAGSLAAYSKAVASMQSLIAIDPSDSKAPIGLAYTLMKMSGQLKKAGDLAGGEKANREAIELVRAVAERPGSGPYEWNEYANALVKADFESLRQPAKGLDFALRASRATKESNPMILDTVAWAYYLSGDAMSAIRTERRALEFVPSGNAMGQGLRRELEQGLAEFEALPKK